MNTDSISELLFISIIANLTRDDPSTPLARQATRTRAALLDAARVAFEARGYANTRIEDITDGAGYSVGTFYTYFTGKDDAFRRVLDAMTAAVPGPDDPLGVPGGRGSRGPGAAPSSPGELLERIERANVRYWRSFTRTGRLWAVFEEAALIDDDARRSLLRRWSRYRASQVAKLERSQARGLVPPFIDLPEALSALAAMTDWLAALRSMYRYRFLRPIDGADLTPIWARALGLEPPESAAGPRSARSNRAGPAARLAERPPAPAGGLGRKGLATRRAILSRSRTVFAASGLSETGIRDLAAAADVSVGTFYKYFDSKEQVLDELLGALVDAMHVDGTSTELRARIEAGNRAYLTEVSTDPGLWRTIAQAAITTPTIRASLARQRDRHVAAASRAVARWHAQGDAPAAADPVVTSHALIALVERCAHLWYVLDDDPPALDRAVAGTTEIWCRVLGVSS